MKLFGVLLIFVVALLAARLGVFYQTGSQWFDQCWDKQAASKNFADPVPKNSAQSVDWAKCEKKSEETAYSLGFVFAGNPKNADPDANELAQACPSLWNDVPLGGLYYLLVKLIERSGGPSILDDFLPAEHLLERTWTSRWPKCSQTRKKLGYPKIVSVGDKWNWERPCEPCKRYEQ